MKMVRSIRTGNSSGNETIVIGFDDGSKLEIMAAEGRTRKPAIYLNLINSSGNATTGGRWRGKNAHFDSRNVDDILSVFRD